MSDSSQEKYNLLLVGRTGNGKSSTGNKILHNESNTIFESNDDAIEFSSALVEGRTVNVIDGTGTGDTGSDAKLDILSLMDCITKNVWGRMDSVDAVILVLKYGARFTKQEKDAVELIKSIFGRDVFKKWGVIVMTHGDNFELDNEDRGATFEDWIKEQTGDFQTLFKECENRCVLFNNRTKDEDKMRTQREKLIDKIKTIHNRLPYTKENYREAETERKKLLVQTKVTKLESETREVVDKNTAKLADVHKNRNQKEITEQLRILNSKLISFKEYLRNEDGGTGLLKNLMLQVDVVELGIMAKMKQFASVQPSPEEHDTSPETEPMITPPIEVPRGMKSFEMKNLASAEENRTTETNSSSKGRRSVDQLLRQCLDWVQSHEKASGFIIILAIIIVIAVPFAIIFS